MTWSLQQKTKHPSVFKCRVSLLLSPKSVPGTTWNMFAVGAPWPERFWVRTPSHTTLTAANDEPAAGAVAHTGHALSDSRREASEGPEPRRLHGALCPLKATKEQRAHLHRAQCPGGDNTDSPSDARMRPVKMKIAVPTAGRELGGAGCSQAARQGSAGRLRCSGTSPKGMVRVSRQIPPGPEGGFPDDAPWF